MIESVHVKHFQSLENTEVQLGTLTVILGPNDLGKSAFFRAIRSAAEAASGADFITYGHSMARVAIRVDGHELVWEKGTNVNRYLLDGTAYEKVGRQIPPDVSSLLGLSPVEFDKNLVLSLNFADQDDPPFLIPFPGGLSTSHVAKVLGDLTNLNVLYRAVGEADTRRRRAEQTLTVRKRDIDQLQSRLQDVRFQGLDQREETLVQLETLWGRANQAHDRWLKLSYLQNELSQFRSRHTSTQAELERTAQFSDCGPQLVKLEAAISDLQELSSKHSKLLAFEQRLQSSLSVVEGAQAAEREASEALRQLMLDLDVCPLCEQEIQHDHGIDAAAPVTA